MSNLTSREIKNLIIFIMFLLWTFYSWTACGQIHNPKTMYKAVNASFGMRSFQLHSNIRELDQLMVTEEGGQLGVIVGNSMVRTKIGIAGFFYSSGSVPRTVDLFESDLSVNFYPLGSSSRNFVVQPYFSGGIVYDKVKFSGYYLNEDKAHINYSSSKEPVLGSIHQIRASVGAGVEFSILENDFEFFHIFTEAKISSAVTQKASVEFAGTRTSSMMLLSIGFRFGAKS